MEANQKRWQDWINLGLGMWMFVMPFFGLVPMDSAAAVNGFFFGAIITVVSVAALVREQTWEEWLNFTIGLWLIAAPFVLGFSTSSIAMWNSIGIGLFIAGDALWAALTGPGPTEPGGEHDAQVM